MSEAYINRIATAVPTHDVHDKFVSFAPALLTDERARRLFHRMAERAQIERRYSVLEPDPDLNRIDREGRFVRGAFPDTGTRMQLYEHHALELAEQALARLGEGWDEGITHLLLTSCTGFYAPGLDLQIVQRFGLNPAVERTVIGFMGCYAAMNALKLARHIVRSDTAARVLVLNLELCTLHLKETDDLEEVLSFLIFADGCAASLVTAKPEGIEIERFHAAIVPDSAGHITWRIGPQAFDMHLSGQVPHVVAQGLPMALRGLLGNRSPQHVGSWAVHPGGRTVLDAVEQAAELAPEVLHHSREVLRLYGNMSSPSIMFVLKRLMEERSSPQLGCAMAFGPGLTAETMLFRTAA